MTKVNKQRKPCSAKKTKKTHHSKGLQCSMKLKGSNSWKKIRVLSKVKVGGIRFFEKTLFQGFWGTKAQNKPKMRCFKFYEKSTWNFSDFSHETIMTYWHKLTQIILLWKTLVQRFWTKSYQNGPRLRFFSYFQQKSMYWTLFIFCMKLQEHKGLKLGER